MADVAGIQAEENQGVKMELTLIDEKGRPTPLLIGLCAAELAIDACIGIAAFRLMKKLSERK